MLNQSLNLNEAKRNLASIQTIKAINPIPDADSIEVASILSWNVVVRKGEFKVGDKIVYFEIDSFLPDSERYSFVGKRRINPITLNTANETYGYRLATAVLRKQVSQGLALKFEELDPTFASVTQEELVDMLSKMSVGSDVTELLGVTKFDRPEIAHDFGALVAPFPSHFVSKTDEERIQNEPASYKQILGQPYYISTKVDGTSITNIWHESELICATRNNVLEKFNAVENFLRKNGVFGNLEKFKDNVIFQSEFYGVGIQKNPLGIQDKRLATFTVIQGNKILGLENMLDVVGKLGLEIPEIMEIGSNDNEQIKRILRKIEEINSTREEVDPVKSTSGPLKIVVQKVVTKNFDYSIAEIIERLNGTVYSTSGKLQEGGVIRPLADVEGREPVSFKVINNKFLIKEK